jgi:hypothetical protein
MVDPFDNLSMEITAEHGKIIRDIRVLRGLFILESHDRKRFGRSYWEARFFPILE